MSEAVLKHRSIDPDDAATETASLPIPLRTGKRAVLECQYFNGFVAVISPSGTRGSFGTSIGTMGSPK